jgi:predicted RNA-binding Zn ribbon-like protein
MRLSRKYAVPPELALLYDFVNSLDARQFTHRGVQYRPRDEFATVSELEKWMMSHRLLKHGCSLTESDHRRALRLREVLRDMLRISPTERRNDHAIEKRLNEVAGDYPLIVVLSRAGGISLRPVGDDRISSLGAILGQLQSASIRNKLDRLKMCASKDCEWVFYDRSKPGSQRWCVTALCGNREKTRAYRLRNQHMR